MGAFTKFIKKSLLAVFPVLAPVLYRKSVLKEDLSLEGRAFVEESGLKVVFRDDQLNVFQSGYNSRTNTIILNRNCTSEGIANHFNMQMSNALVHKNDVENQENRGGEIKKLGDRLRAYIKQNISDEDRKFVQQQELGIDFSDRKKMDFQSVYDGHNHSILLNVHESPEKVLENFKKELSVVKEYHARLERIKKRLCQTEAGAALVYFIEENNTPLRIDADWMKEIGSTGVYDFRKNAITLNAASTDDQMLSTLVHEIRHAWQHRVCDGLLEEKSHLSPLAERGIMLFVEADAYMFERKFLEDYAQKTGEVAVLKDSHFSREHSDLSDEGRFEDAFDMMILSKKKNAVYSASLLSGYTEYTDDWEKGIQVNDIYPIVDENESYQRFLNIARQIDHCWVLPPKGDAGVHYLSRHTDEMLDDAARSVMDDAEMYKLDDADAVYQRVLKQEGGKKISPPSHHSL